MLSYYQVKETNNTNPRILRSSLGAIPVSQYLLNQSGLMLSLYLNPFADIPEGDTQIPTVDINDDTIYRCKRCGSYINNKYIIKYDAYYRKVTCNICNYEQSINDGEKGVKSEYLNSDIATIPELNNPTVDFIAPSKYKKENYTFKPHYIFMIDIENNSFNLGLPGYIINSIQCNLEAFDNKENSFISIALYDNTNIYFFHMNKGECKITLMNDLNDAFCPLSPSQMYFNVVSQRKEIDSLFEKINLFINDRCSNDKKQKSLSTPTGSAIKAGISSLIDIGGRVLVFTPNPCSIGYGKCDTNTNSKTLPSIFAPLHDLFTPLAEIANKNSIVVDQFIFLSTVYALSTMSTISSLTGGDVHYYPYSNDQVILSSYYEKMHYDIERIVSRHNYYDVIFMFRCSLGVECAEILSSFGKKTSEAFQIAGWNGDSSLLYQLRLTESFQQGQQIHFQIVCLYTDNYGERKIRLFNSSYSTADSFGKIYNEADCEVIIKSLLMKQIDLAYRMGLDSMRKDLCSFVVNCYYTYRYRERKQMPLDQLIIPPTLKNLALFIDSFIKKGVIGGFNGNTQINDSVYLFYKIMKEPIESTIKSLYPKLYRIDDIQRDQLHKFQVENATIKENIGIFNEEYQMIQKPYVLPLSKDSIDFDNAYILDDGEYITVFIFDQIDEKFYIDLFGVSTWKEAKEVNQNLSEDNQSDLNIRVLNIISQLKKENKGSYQPVRLMFYEDSGVYKQYTENYLIEDKVHNDCSYNDFLCGIHNEIKMKLK